MCRVTRAKKDLRYATSLLKPILGMVGAWPIPASAPLLLKICQTVVHVVTYFLFFVLIIPSLLFYLKKANTLLKVKMIGPIVNCGLQAVKYTILLCRSKQIREGLDAIEQDLIEASEQHRSIYLEKAKAGRKVMIIVVVTMFGGGLLYRAILPLLRGTIVTANNVTIRPLPCPTYLVFLDPQQSPVYEILYTLQVMSGVVSYAVTSGTSGISTLVVLHACSMLKILTNKLKDLVNETDVSDATVERKIKDIVVHQSKIKKFLKTVQTITEYIFLIELANDICLICLIGYNAIKELENRNATSVMIHVILQISFTFCVFIVCYIGQLLVDENDIVGRTSCTVDWYRLRTKHARSLILIIAMSNYPMKLTAGKTVEMSLATFTNVIKLSMVYLNLLREIT